VRVTWPTYADVMAHGIGAYLHDPVKAEPKRVFVN